MATTIRARPTTYKGIQMRSRLEADYAAHLDAAGSKWLYEAACFASDEGQWLPDFAIGKALIEVKPAAPLQAHIPGSLAYVDHVDVVLRRMSVAWATDPAYGLCLDFWTYGGPSFLRVRSAGQGQPWIADCGDHGMFIWPGMSQLARLIDWASDAKPSAAAAAIGDRYGKLQKGTRKGRLAAKLIGADR